MLTYDAVKLLEPAATGERCKGTLTVASHCLLPNLPIMWTAHSASHATRVKCQNHCDVGSSNRASPLAAEPAIASRVIEIVSRLSTGRRHMGHL